MKIANARGQTAKPHGFTLVELIIALAIFGFMLMVVSAGFVQVSRIYQSGVASRRTQQAARAVMNDIAIETRSANHIAQVGTDRLCLTGAQTILYRRHEENVLTKSLADSCDSEEPFAEVVLIGAGGNFDHVVMRQFNTSAIQADEDKPAASAEVTIVVTTGFSDVCDNNEAGPGSQFCSTTEFTNTISLRAN